MVAPRATAVGGGSALRLWCVMAVMLAAGSVLSQELPLDGSSFGGAGAAETFNPSSDPLGDIDTYKSLSQADIEGQWSKDDGRNVTEKMEELQTFSSIVHVDVKLVGFDGDGNYGLKVAEADFLRYFETVLEEHEKEAMVLNSAAGTSHSLPIRRKFFFRVVKAKKTLNEDVSSRIRSWLLTDGKDTESDASIRHTVPVGIVDEVIAKDYREGDLSKTHTIYLLNPKRVMAPPRKQASGAAGAGAGAGGGDPSQAGKNNDALPSFSESNEGAGDPDKKWTGGLDMDDEPEVLKYEYDPTDKQDKAAAGEKAFGKTRRPCGTAMWAGQERYMWIDLTAGPLLYGPHTSGDGLVSEFSVPRLDNFQVEHEEGHGGHHFAFIQEFLAEVVALVGKTADLLIEPSLDHFPVPLAQTLRLHLVHITNDPAVKTQFADEHGFMAGMPQVAAWNNIKEQLGHRGANIAMQGQNIMYNRSVVQMNECKFCLAAYAAALRSHTSTVLRGQLKTQVHEYMDSKELHEQLLSLLNREELNFAAHLGIYGWVPTQLRDDRSAYRDHWTIPVFVFDLQDPALLLLDRFHQAVSFPEMVVGLQTKSGAATLDYSCSDEMVTLDAADATRPLMGALLQTGWGVAPTHQHFSGKKQSAEVNFLWSAANTPFGPFSGSSKLNFALIDAARRNLVFSALNASIEQVSDVLEQFSRFGKHMEDVLLPAEHVHFVRRWNVLKFKIRRTSTYLSLLNFNTALFYARRYTPCIVCMYILSIHTIRRTCTYASSASTLHCSKCAGVNSIYLHTIH